MTYALFVALGFAGAMISAVFGFGSALVVLTLGPYLIPVDQSIALAAVLFGATTFTKTFLFGKYINWKIVAIMALTSLPFAYLGAYLMPAVPASALRRMLGAMILIYIGTQVFKVLPKFKIGIPGLMVGSAGYGFLSGLLGSGGLIKVIMFRELSITREAFVGAMAATSVLASAAKITAYVQAGLLNATLAWPMVGLCVVAVIASVTGRLLISKVSIAYFDQAVLALLAVAAAGLLL